jgi:hypothetical protein
MDSEWRWFVYLGKKKLKQLKTYHIYYDDKCLFKDLDEEEFDIIWGRIYKSYHTDSLSYSLIMGDTSLEESSF